MESAGTFAFENQMNGLRYISLAGTSGYAEAGRRYMTAFMRQGLPVTWTPMVPGKSWGLGFEPFEGRSAGDPELDPICNLPIAHDTVLFHMMPTFYPRLVEMVGPKRIAASSVWETDRLPSHWGALLKDIELLLIPCEWNRKLFQDGGFTKPIEVIPYSLLPGQSPLPYPPEDGAFVFYSINQWIDRKAIDLTLHAFLRAFTSRDRVRFVKTSERHEMRRIPFTMQYPIHTRWLVSRILKKYPGHPPVTVITERLSNDAIRDLHLNGDCYVSLTRSEGWGMGAFDAAAYGRPVIITGFGGQTEFLPPDLAHLVKCRMVKAPFQPMEQTEWGHQWAEPDVNHGAELMRYVFENRAETRAKAAILADRICATYQPDPVAAHLHDTLQKYF